MVTPSLIYFMCNLILYHNVGIMSWTSASLEVSHRYTRSRATEPDQASPGSSNGKGPRQSKTDPQESHSRIAELATK
jgi:hypothetical protein